MFLSVNKSFQISYFLSSLLPVYILLIIWLIINAAGCFSKNLILTLSILGILCLGGIICLFEIRRQLRETIGYAKFQGIEKIKINDEYNSGYRDFLLSTLLPLLTSFFLKENPLGGLIMVLLIQSMIYVFFISSSDFFPNISLMCMGISIYNGSLKNRKVYCIGKRKRVKSYI